MGIQPEVYGAEWGVEIRSLLRRRPSLAQAIVDTVREPLLVLDKDLRVVAASRSFYMTFQ